VGLVALQASGELRKELRIIQPWFDRATCPECPRRSEAPNSPRPRMLIVVVSLLTMI
jgi:hypothetical protein